MPWLAVGVLVFNSCGGGGGGSGREDPTALAPTSLVGWAVVFDQMDGGTNIRDIQALIISEQSGIVSINSGGEYVSGLTFEYSQIGASNKGRLVITENKKDNFTIVLDIIFEEYHKKDSGSTAFGYLENWSYIDEAGANLSGSTGRFTGRQQQ